MNITYSLRNKLIALVVVAIVPFLVLTVYVIIALQNYSTAYDEIVSNMTVANSYNLNFKEELDESIYKLVVGTVTFENIEEDDSLTNPYTLIDELRSDFGELVNITTDKESRKWLLSLLRNISTLRDRVNDIKQNLDEGNQYDENIEMLDNNIYILTELIQDDIQYYIYYQTVSIEQLKNSLNEQVESFVALFAGIGFSIVVIVIIITTYVLSSITKPVHELSQATKKIAGGDFSTRVTVGTKDEIGTLADSVNEMTEHLEDFVEKIKEDERKMRHTELRLLQEQINPHFLYNTLDTIVWLVEGNATDKAVNMVVSLSDFFRIVLSKGKDVITLKEEEQHIRSYLEIQQVRYRDILDYDIQIPQELYQYKILKLTLQPLVENSLYHGIKTKRGKGTIYVRGRLEGEKIYLDVKDTGVGMNEAELASLRSKITRPCKETDSGFGLANVNERLRMNYGPEYGMTIHSILGEGTWVQVVIPALSIHEEEPIKEKIAEGE